MNLLKLQDDYDKEKLELAREKLRNFQKEMREVDLKNLDEIQEEFITYIKDKKNRYNFRANGFNK